MKFLDPYTKEKFWLVHSVIQTHPLEVGIKQVKLHLIARKVLKAILQPKL